MDRARTLASLAGSIALAGSLLLGTPGSAHGSSATIFVGSSSAGGGTASCAHPDFTVDGTLDNETIANAVEDVPDGGTIVLCAATYVFGADVASITKSITFQGEGATKTILTTSAETRFFRSANDAHLTLTFTDLTMQGGTANPDEAWAGAVWGESYTNLVITRCIFRDNYAENGMGALFSRSGDITVTDSLFDGNGSGSGEQESAYSGGAIGTGHFDDFFSVINEDPGTVTILNSTFTNNSTTQISAGGGAIYADGPLTVRNSTFDGNTAVEVGGAIAAGLISNGANHPIEITGSTFRNNVTRWWGGAVNVWNYGSTLLISGDVFTNNIGGAGHVGGALNVWSATVIDTSTFTGNRVGGLDGWGGAINFGFSGVGSLRTSISLTHCRFTQNTASGVAGAVDIQNFGVGDSLANVRGNRFVRNVAANGGGIALVNYGNSTAPASIVARLQAANTFSGNRGGRFANVGRFAAVID